MVEDGDIPKAQDQIRILGYNYFRGDETGVTKDARDRGRKRERVRKKAVDCYCPGENVA